MPDPRSQKKEIPLNGKLLTDEPASIGVNFQTLKNYQYTDTHIRGIRGMTELGGVANTDTDDWGNSDDFGNSDDWGASGTYFETRNAFHFVKEQPYETHLLAQKFATGGASSAILDCTAAPPSAGDFSSTVVLSNTGTGRGYFCNAPDEKIIFCNGIDTHIWGGNESQCNAFITSTGAITTGGATTPVDYSAVISNTKTDAANIATVGGGVKWWLVGSTLPLQGMKVYVATANTTAGTMSGTYWDGNSWENLGITDNTKSGTDTLVATGTVTWATTVNLAKPMYLEGYYLYWYQFTVTAADATTTISYITLDAPFQKIVDIWDGVYRDVLRFFKTTTTQLDNTLNVLKDDYYVTDTTTYSDLSSLGAYSDPANCLEIGFEEKQTAIYFNIAPDYTNSTAASTASIDFWNGTAYTTAGAIVDGTSSGSIMFAKPGVISWNSNTLTGETVKIVSNSPPLYYYRVKSDKAMDASVRVNYVGGITAQKEITYFKFPVLAQGRILLCADMSQSKNMIRCSGKFTPQVYNGSDSIDIYFGTNGELTCGTELFSLFGSSLYSLCLIFKDNETWVITGADINEWESNTFLLSPSIGCPAPMTLKTINLHAEPGAGINRALAVWQGTNGIFMSDGRAPIPIHGDISAYFDPTDSRCINSSMIGESIGEIDSANHTYHWLFASGSSATAINKELVYDIKRNKWFEIDRGINGVLNFIALVRDTYGNSYQYGFRLNGKVYRLEYGSTFNGIAIEHEFQTGDISLGGLSVETQIDRIRFIAVSRTNISDPVTLTHYGDAADVGIAKELSMFESSKRIVQNVATDKLKGDSFHSFKGVTTTKAESTGPEPLALVVTYHPVHQD